MLRTVDHSTVAGALDLADQDVLSRQHLPSRDGGACELSCCSWRCSDDAIVAGTFGGGGSEAGRIDFPPAFSAAEGDALIGVLEGPTAIIWLSLPLPPLRIMSSAVSIRCSRIILAMG